MSCEPLLPLSTSTSTPTMSPSLLASSSTSTALSTSSSLLSSSFTSTPTSLTTSSTAESEISFDFRKDNEVLIPQLSVKHQNELVVIQKAAWQKAWGVRWGKQKFVDPLFVILQRGLEPKLLSLSAALGLTFGVFPVCGMPLLLCAIAAMALQRYCHVPTLMLAHILSSVLELGLVVPFMRVGELVTGGDHLSISSSGLWEAFRRHEPQALVFGVLHAIIGWCVFAPISVSILYICLLPLFQYLNARFSIVNHQTHRDENGRVNGANTRLLVSDPHVIAI